MHLVLVANIVTTSKALVTRSDALVPSSFFVPSSTVSCVWFKANTGPAKLPIASRAISAALLESFQQKSDYK